MYLQIAEPLLKFYTNNSPLVAFCKSQKKNEPLFTTTRMLTKELHSDLHVERLDKTQNIFLNILNW